MKYLEDNAGDVVSGLVVQIGTPLVYELDADLKPFPNEFRRSSWQDHPCHLEYLKNGAAMSSLA